MAESERDKAFEATFPVTAQDRDPRTGELFREAALIRTSFFAGWESFAAAAQAAMPEMMGPFGGPTGAVWDKCLYQMAEGLAALRAGEGEKHEGQG